MPYGNGLPDFVPSFTYQPRKIAQELAIDFEGKVVVDLGAGGRKIVPWAITVDMAALPGTDVVCNFEEERTPFEDGSVDLVICTGVLEHVKDERVVMREIARILKQGATVHIEIPFLQQYHEDPIDCRRLTLPGLELFLEKAGFSVVKSGVHIGPTTTILTLTSYYVDLVLGGESAFRKAIGNMAFASFCLLFWPARYLDKLLITKPKAHRLAFGVFATAIKRWALPPGVLYSYASGLSRLLPSRALPPEIEITDDMLRLQAFKVEEKERGDASLSPGDRQPLQPISEFGAKPYTEEEKRSLLEIIQSFNERHGTEFTEEDFLRFEQVNHEILDDDMAEMLRNNPPDVVYGAFSQAFFQGAIRMFQRDNEMKSIVMSDAEAREKAVRHFFNRALREVREAPQRPVS